MISESKQNLFSRQAEVIKAAGHPIRIAILEFLKGEEQCVCDIAKYVGSEQSNVSKHLSILANAGLVESRKDGLKVIYRLRCVCVLKFLACVTDMIKEQAKSEARLLKAI